MTHFTEAGYEVRKGSVRQENVWWCYLQNLWRTRDRACSRCTKKLMRRGTKEKSSEMVVTTGRATLNKQETSVRYGKKQCQFIIGIEEAR